MSNRFFPNYKTYLITSRFGLRKLNGVEKPHKGIDLTATNDGKVGHTDKILAHTGGTVTAVGYGSSVGNYVKIQTEPGVVMVYYHLREMSALKVGQAVKAGDPIGYMGSTGTSTGAHLHWGIQVDGQWIDPEPYLDADYSRAAKTVQVELRVLKKGAKGEDVQALQELLNGHGYDLEVDGSFGGATEKALKSYQEAHGLTVDGSCGRATWTSLLGGG